MVKKKKGIIKQNESGKEKQIISKLNIFLLRYFNLLVLLLVIIFLGFGFFNVIKPKYHSIAKEIESTDKEKEAEYEDLDKYYSSLKKYLLAFNEIQEKERDKIDKMIPEKFVKEELFRDLESIILRKGLLLISLSVNTSNGNKSSKRNPSQTNKASNGGSAEIGNVKITMEIAGVDYKSFKILLDTMENNLRLLDIENIDFSPEAKTLTLNLNAYYFK